MPGIVQKQTVQIQNVKSENSEITINLNLTITIDNGEIKISASGYPKLPEKEIEKQLPEEQFIPDGLIDDDMPILKNFGK